MKTEPKYVNINMGENFIPTPKKIKIKNAIAYDIKPSEKKESFIVDFNFSFEKNNSTQISAKQYSQ